MNTATTYHRAKFLEINAIDVAARTPFERLTNNETLGVAMYRFDTRVIHGDYTIIEVALPFASEEAARNAFYQLIKA